MGEPAESKRLVIAVCYGEACKDNEAKKVRARLKELVKAAGCKESVKIKKAECLGDCKHGPIVECASISRRFTKATPAAAESIFEQCLAGKPAKKAKKPVKKAENHAEEKTEKKKIKKVPAKTAKTPGKKAAK